MFKVNNKHSKTTLLTVFSIVNFEHISHLSLVSLLLNDKPHIIIFLLFILETVHIVNICEYLSHVSVACHYSEISPWN